MPPGTVLATRWRNMCEAICLVKSYVIVKRYVKRNITSDAISNIYVKRNKYSKRGRTGYTCLQSNTVLKSGAIMKRDGISIFWLYTLAHLTIDVWSFPSLYLDVSESHIA